MKIYRLQHPKSGKGPYHHRLYNESDYDLNDICGNMSSANCPEPELDKLLVQNYRAQFNYKYKISHTNWQGFLFAFNEIAQLKKWFSSPGIMKLIAHHGFEVAVKEIPNKFVVTGDSQCIVDHDVWINTSVLENWIPERYRARYEAKLAAS